MQLSAQVYYLKELKRISFLLFLSISGIDQKSCYLWSYEGYFVGVVGPSGEFYQCTIILGYFQISAKVITNVKAPFPGVEQFIHTNITQVW